MLPERDQGPEFRLFLRPDAVGIRVLFNESVPVNSDPFDHSGAADLRDMVIEELEKRDWRTRDGAIIPEITGAYYFSERNGIPRSDMTLIFYASNDGNPS